MKKLTIMFLLLISVLILTSCDEPSEDIDYLALYGPNFKMENMYPTKNNLYGMCDLSWSNYSWYGIDYKMSTQLIENLGSKSVRLWLHCHWVMDDPTTYDEKGLSLARDIVDGLTEKGIEIVGLNHGNFHPQGMANSLSNTAKPARDLTEGSLYMNWLNDYKTTWYNLVRQFPEIKYWEIDNEPNNDLFFENLTGGTFSLQEKAQIFTDMLYFASLGIHEANPEANTVMGGIVVNRAETFLEYMYDEIYSENSWSKYPDDYFQIAAWHPYLSTFTAEKFARTNNDIYAVIKNREGKDKRVMFTEYGYSEVLANLNDCNTYLEQTLRFFETCPYLESTYYFRIYDALGNNWGVAAGKKYGLFTDPITHGMDNSNEVLASPKTTAYTFQKYAGGSGSLTIYEEFLKN